MFPSIRIPDSVTFMATTTCFLAAANPMVVSVYAGAMVRWARGSATQGPDTTRGYYCGTVMLVAIVSILWWGGEAVLQGPSGGWADETSRWWVMGSATLLAPGLGWGAFVLERHLSRKMTRAHRVRTTVAPSLPASPTAICAASPWSEREAVHSVARDLPALRNEAMQPAVSGPLGAPSILIATGFCEEALFRGVLVGVPVVVYGASTFSAAAIATLWFTVAHIHFGGSQVFLKLPLSITATLLYVVGGFLPAAVAHATFNWRVNEFLRSHRIQS